MEERLFFAEQIEDHGVTIGHHIQGKQWQQALDVMAQQHDPNSFYKHSPVLMKHLPGPTVSVLLQFTPGTNSKRNEYLRFNQSSNQSKLLDNDGVTE